MKRTQIMIVIVCAITATIMAVGVFVAIRYWCPGTICILMSDATELYCPSKGLESIPLGCLNSHSEVETLHLQRNNISVVCKDDLKMMSSLRVLDLSQNRINNIEPGALNSLENLEELRLFDNKLASVPSLVHNPEVSSVWLYRNEIIYVPEEVFAPGVKVDLRLQGNKFNTLHARTFFEVANGTQLAIDHGVTICAKDEQELEQLLGIYIRIWVEGTAVELENVSRVC
ncbi:keratocan-like [Oratosquilla oratoria]|uniref:keratocan-like n=1 Tax=Oratosquilla oratoria TaxID=337810 RepID=UPI003F75D72D